MVGWLLAGAIVIAPASAVAQQRDPTPSARELWKTYPLRQKSVTATPSEAAATAAETSGRTSVPVETSSGAGGPSLLLLAGAIGTLLTLAGLAAVRRRNPRRRAGAAGAAPVLLTATVGAMAPEKRPRSPRLTALTAVPEDRREAPRRDQRPVSALEPPDPAQPWSAEIVWQDAARGPRFCLVARPAGGGSDALIAASDPLTWPPPDAAAVRQMRNEVARVEAEALESGWSPLPPGSAWYSKRFGWAAVAQPVSTGRFRRDVEWPAETEALWRCEIKWKPGYVNSRFTVVTYEPGRKRGRTMGESATFKWLLMADATPQSLEQRTQVHALDEQLLAAGWEAAGRGRDWCARRYVWRREGAPPEHLERPGREATGTSR